MGKSVWVWSILSKGILHVCENVCIHSASLLYGLLLRAIFTKTRARTIMIEKRFWERTCRADYQSPQSIFMDWPNHVQYCNFTNFLYVQWSMVLPKLKRHLNDKNILSAHSSIHGHRNLNETKCSAITRHWKFVKMTVPGDNRPSEVQGVAIPEWTGAPGSWAGLSRVVC